MNKLAAGKSSDPKQQALRDAKAKWNKSTSEFIADLIQYKKMFNGWPSKYDNEKIRIQNAMPDKASSVLTLLTMDFKDLAEQAHGIAQMQLDYSKTRRKSTKNSVIASQIYQLESLASNPLTRLWTRIRNTTITNSDAARTKKYRVSLLSAAADIYRDIETLQAEVVKTSGESIFVSSKLLDKIKKRWAFVNNSLGSLNFKMPEKTDSPESASKNNPAESAIEAPAEVTDPFAKTTALIQDVSANISNFMNLDTKALLQKIIKFRKKNISDADKTAAGAEVESEYKKLLDKANEEVKATAQSFGELAGIKAGEPQQNKVATDNPVARWVGKLNHKLNPFDKTSAIRLDVYNTLSKTKDLVDDFMDELQGAMNGGKLTALSNSILAALAQSETYLSTLLATTDGQSFENKFINLLDKGKITEYDLDFDDKQRERLQRVLELKRFRELANQYKGKKK